MRKRLFLFLPICVILAFSGTVKSQVLHLSTDTVILTDTLHYYFNKYYFKTGDSLKKFPFYKSAASTVTNITHLGNKFENVDTLQILGLQGFATRNGSSAQLNIKVHLYLCNIGNDGKPVMPPLDSVVTSVGGSEVPTLPIGGPLHNGMKKVNGNFAVLIRNMSTISGDTVRVFRTAGMTFTSNAEWKMKHSDGFGFVRNNGVFHSTTDYTTTGFGQGTGYEFLVAPIVRYKLWAAHEVPPKVQNADPFDPLCTFDQYNFCNKSAKQWTHRMYNLNDFYRYWSYYSSFAKTPINGNWPSDSAITWYFEPHDGGAMERIFLPGCGSFNGCNNCVKFHAGKAFTDVWGQDSVVCYTDNAFRARFRGMAIYGRGQVFDTKDPISQLDTLKFTICTSFCGDDGVGLVSQEEMDKIRMFPNPAVHGLCSVYGLKGKNEISVYNMTGKLLLRETTEKNNIEIDLHNQAIGSYFVRIVNSSGNASRQFKVIRQ